MTEPIATASDIGGKPSITLDHVSIAPGQGGGVVVILTLSIALDDLQAVDMILRAVGTLARSRGVGEVP